jgi:YebC/PmpR family DNA-binding regulatory protein
MRRVFCYNNNMSGHSKWSTIKRQKGVADAKKGQAFTKLAKNITMAVQTGGGADPAMNFKLRMAIDKAREVSMPNDNIDRAIKRGTGEGKEAIKAVTYEGYGPNGSAFIIDAVTDNSNRTLQSIRNIFNKNGGRMGEQGSVAWMFESRGQILVEKQSGTDELSLQLIDQGVEDVQESEEGLEIYTAPNDLEKIKKFIEQQGLKVLSADNIMKPQQSITLSAEDNTIVQTLTDALNDDDDVVSVHTNL